MLAHRSGLLVPQVRLVPMAPLVPMALKDPPVRLAPVYNRPSSMPTVSWSSP